MHSPPLGKRSKVARFRAYYVAGPRPSVRPDETCNLAIVVLLSASGRAQDLTTRASGRVGPSRPSRAINAWPEDAAVVTAPLSKEVRKPLACACAPDAYVDGFGPWCVADG